MALAAGTRILDGPPDWVPGLGRSVPSARSARCQQTRGPRARRQPPPAAKRAADREAEPLIFLPLWLEMRTSGGGESGNGSAGVVPLQSFVTNKNGDRAPLGTLSPWHHGCGVAEGSVDLSFVLHLGFGLVFHQRRRDACHLGVVIVQVGLILKDNRFVLYHVIQQLEQAAQLLGVQVGRS